MVPYTLASIGYPGLLLVTLFFVWRFLASLEARGRVTVHGEAHATVPVPVPEHAS
jgi:nitric oxide reductase subunit B